MSQIFAYNICDCKRKTIDRNSWFVGFDIQPPASSRRVVLGAHGTYFPFI